MSVYDEPAIGGGPTSGQTRQQVINIVHQEVAAQALQGNVQRWSINKVPTVNSDAVTEGNNNLYFTDARVYQEVKDALDGNAGWTFDDTNMEITAPTGGGQSIFIGRWQTRTAYSAGDWVYWNNKFYVARNNIADTTISFPNLDTTNWAVQTINADNIFTPTQANLYPFVKDIIIGGMDDDVGHEITIKEGFYASTDTVVDATGVDDANWFSVNIGGSPRRITVAQLRTLLGLSIQYASPSITGFSIAGLNPASGDLAGTYSISYHVSNSQNVAGNVTFQYSIDSGTTYTDVVDNLSPTATTASVTLASIPIAAGASVLFRLILTDTQTPAQTHTSNIFRVTRALPTETAYFGSQNSNSFAGYSTASASGSADVSATSGRFHAMAATPQTHWFYILMPSNRPISELQGALGVDELDQLTTINNAVTLNGQVYTAYVIQNNGLLTLTPQYEVIWRP